MRGRTHGGRDERLYPLAGLLVLFLVFLWAVREARWPAAHPPLSHPSGSSPFPGAAEAGPPALEQLSRRYVGRGYTLEVIYASPLLPLDEAANPVFRIVALYSASGQGGRLPRNLGLHAQVRTSDGRVQENLVWQEEIRHPGRVLGYLSCRAGGPGEGSPFVTSRTRWVELSLTGLADHPLRFRWPVK